MISLTRLNGRAIVVNAEMIETIEQTPDSVVTLAHGKKLVVLETLEEIIDRVVEYRQKIAGTPAGQDPRQLVFDAVSGQSS